LGIYQGSNFPRWAISYSDYPPVVDYVAGPAQQSRRQRHLLNIEAFTVIEIKYQARASRKVDIENPECTVFFATTIPTYAPQNAGLTGTLCASRKLVSSVIASAPVVAFRS